MPRIRRGTHINENSQQGDNDMGTVLPPDKIQHTEGVFCNNCKVYMQPAAGRCWVCPVCGDGNQLCGG